jgi:hypothetical protein
MPQRNPSAAPEPQAYTRPALRIRPGMRVITSCRQNRLGGQKYPGRRGRVHENTGYPDGHGGSYWTVHLEPTARGKARPGEWYQDRELIPETLTYWPDGVEG